MDCKVIQKSKEVKVGMVHKKGGIYENTIIPWAEAKDRQISIIL